MDLSPWPYLGNSQHLKRTRWVRLLGLQRRIAWTQPLHPLPYLQAARLQLNLPSPMGDRISHCSFSNATFARLPLLTTRFCWATWRTGIRDGGDCLQRLRPESWDSLQASQTRQKAPACLLLAMPWLELSSHSSRAESAQQNSSRTHFLSNIVKVMRNQDSQGKLPTNFITKLPQVEILLSPLKNKH